MITEEQARKNTIQAIKRINKEIARLRKSDDPADQREANRLEREVAKYEATL